MIEQSRPLRMSENRTDNPALDWTAYAACRLIEFLRGVKATVKSLFSVRAIRLLRSPQIAEYCAYNGTLFSSKTNDREKMVLMDCTVIPQWLFVNSFFTNSLADRLDASVVTYGTSRRDLLADGLFKSFGCSRHLIVSLTKTQRTERRKRFEEILMSVNTKRDLFELKLEGVWIGMDIYESILRSGVPTVDVAAFRSKYFIFNALSYHIFFMDLFRSARVSAVSLSHDCYISMGLVSRIAYRFDVPVYFSESSSFTKTTHTHQLYERFRRFPSYFNSLTSAEKESGVEWAKKQLERRLSGVVGVNMSYQEKSAFASSRVPTQTTASEKTKIVVATHCFFDNPHCYGGMLFLDFYEWLCYLGEISEITDYEWFLKPHPDYLPGTLETLTRVSKLYPKLRLIDPATSFHQLRHEGVSVALTCYGSIGHELPLLGYKVVNAGYNPHIAYKFNWHAETLEHYRELLLNLPELGDVAELEKIYEFYYISHVFDRPSDFLFESLAAYTADAGRDVLGPPAFGAFLKQKEIFRDKANKRIAEFLDADSTYSAEQRIASNC